MGHIDRFAVDASAAGRLQRVHRDIVAVEGQAAPVASPRRARRQFIGHRYRGEIAASQPLQEKGTTSVVRLVYVLYNPVICEPVGRHYTKATKISEDTERPSCISEGTGSPGFFDGRKFVRSIVFSVLLNDRLLFLSYRTIVARVVDSNTPSTLRVSTMEALGKRLGRRSAHHWKRLGLSA
jgi:hypothetical protein